MKPRVVDWRSRLSDVIEEKRRTPLAWGAHDCALFAADCILAMTGDDLAESFRGRYVDLEGGLRLMQAAGYGSLVDLAGGYLEEIHPAFTRMGDVMAFPVETTGGWSLGIVNGERVTVLREDGLGTMARTEAARAFRVP